MWGERKFSYYTIWIVIPDTIAGYFASDTTKEAGWIISVLTVNQKIKKDTNVLYLQLNLTAGAIEKCARLEMKTALTL